MNFWDILLAIIIIAGFIFVVWFVLYILSLLGIQAPPGW